MITNAPEERELLAAVCRAPSDDDARRAYEAFVRPHGPEGEARAEFIRMQLKARLPKFANLSTHANRLLTPERRDAWSNGIASRASFVSYSRGFVNAVAVPASTLVADPNAFFGAAPIEHLELFGAAGLGPALAAIPQWSQVRTVSLADNHLGDVAFAALIDHIAHPGIEWLGLAGNDLGLPGFEALAAATGRMPALRGIGSHGANAVAIEPQVESFQGQSQVVWLPPAAEQLRAKYGDLRWLLNASMSRPD